MGYLASLTKQVAGLNDVSANVDDDDEDDEERSARGRRPDLECPDNTPIIRPSARGVDRDVLRQKQKTIWIADPEVYIFLPFGRTIYSSSY